MDWDQWRHLLSETRLPAAIVDLDRLDENLAVLLAAARPGPTLRLATKSIRVPELLRYVLGNADRVRGLMTFSPYETAFLASLGFDDLLLAYPVGRPDEADAVAVAARSSVVRVVVDHVDQASLLSAAAVAAGVTIGLCVDVDVSWRPLGPLAHLGVRRSPIRGAADALALADAVRELPNVVLDAVMAYEAQVAGLADVVPGEALMAPARRLIKARSVALAAARRAEVVEALRGTGFTLSVVNGGGSGSVASTSADASVTEVTIGSGLYCSHLFDGYDGLTLQPALVFALGVVRSSDPDHVTCAGGGYVASGAPGVSRLPVVLAPPGLTPVALEGFGEVQTPFRRGPGAPALTLGDPVICRPAKAGEPLERFDRVHLVRNGQIIDATPTLRGLGQTFL